jgi:hypothetical protein
MTFFEYKALQDNNTNKYNFQKLGTLDRAVNNKFERNDK